MLKQIADYAEFLSYYRKDDEVYKQETREKYFYFDVDGIQQTEENIMKTLDLSEDIFMVNLKKRPFYNLIWIYGSRRNANGGAPRRTFLLCRTTCLNGKN